MVFFAILPSHPVISIPSHPAFQSPPSLPLTPRSFSYLQSFPSLPPLLSSSPTDPDLNLPGHFSPSVLSEESGAK